MRETPGDRERAFRHFEAGRKPCTDELDRLSNDHFRYLNEHASTAVQMAASLIDRRLSAWLPRLWLFPYNMIISPRYSYLQARRRRLAQRLAWVVTGLWIVQAALVVWLLVQFFRRKEIDP